MFHRPINPFTSNSHHTCLYHPMILTLSKQPLPIVLTIKLRTTGNTSLITRISSSHRPRYQSSHHTGITEHSSCPMHLIIPSSSSSPSTFVHSSSRAKYCISHHPIVLTINPRTNHTGNTLSTKCCISYRPIVLTVNPHTTHTGNSHRTYLIIPWSSLSILIHTIPVTLFSFPMHLIIPPSSSSLPIDRPTADPDGSPHRSERLPGRRLPEPRRRQCSHAHRGREAAQGRPPRPHRHYQRPHVRPDR